MSLLSAETRQPAKLRDWRTTILLAGLVLFWIVLTGRLIHLQAFSSESFASQAYRQQVSRETLPARPGDILDRRGRLLATTVQVPSLYVDPSQVKQPEELSLKLADVLGLDREHLQEQLDRHKEKRFLWIKRRLSTQEADAVVALELPGSVAGFRFEFQRHYPQGGVAAHLLGLRTIDNEGRGGIEESRDDVLRGQPGTRRFVRDARGYVLDVLEEVTEPPRDGQNIVLCIDSVIQLLTEKSLDDLVSEYHPKGACAVVMAPGTGEILAMASRPAFDPNRPVDVPEEAWKNLSISAVFEPGSTFKPLVVARALDLNLIRQEEVFDCEWGAYRMGRRVLHDHHRYGELSLTDVLVKSSNIAMAKIGERMTNTGLFEVCRDFGFGRPTGVELRGELSGILHPPESWTGYSTGSIPMGQELAATPLQIISAHAVLANGGHRITPHVILKEGTEAAPVAWSAGLPIVSEATCRWLVTGPMTQVVTRGTGVKAQVKDYTVFGKTGTAQKLNEQKGGYSNSRHISSFVCGAPASKPAALVLVMVDEPAKGESQFGGIVAAPAAARILDQTLKYLQVVEEKEGSGG